MTDALLPHHLDRSILIHAPRATVFSFLTDSSRWATWWGAGSTIDPHAGGKVYIRHPNGIEAGGRILSIAPPERLVFSYGFNSGVPMPLEASRVTMSFDDEAGSTRVRLLHEFAESPVRDEHVQGWRYQLSLFSNVVASVVHEGAAGKVDTWFAAWAEPDSTTREAMLASVALPSVQFRDQYSCVDGFAELLPHIAAAQRFMPGMKLTREGDVRHCQGTVLANWKAIGPDGQSRGQGTNVFTMAPDGRIESATGLWN
ncbi:MAG: SRPBCC domain-containing protein [Vicinamibacterales bacterium]